MVDADRAMRFFGALFGWQAEHVPFDGHVSHYTVNTTTTIRILDDPTSPPSCRTTPLPTSHAR